MSTNLSLKFLADLVNKKRYGVEYQPIIETATQRIFAYECLARFFDNSNNPIPPALVFNQLHKEPSYLFQVEYEQKQLQLSNAPDNTKIFINLDQDSYHTYNFKKSVNPFIKLLKSFQNNDITVELIENTKINDAVLSLSMVDVLSNNNISTAIDDVCSPQSMLSTSVIQVVDYIKLDKHVVINRQDYNFMNLVNSIIDYAHKSMKKIILEGVENYDDLLFAHQLNVDYVQGFLYKDKFINIS